MSEEKNPKWLEWTREIQSLCQTGLAFSQTNYETERYERLIQLTAEIVAEHSQLDKDELARQLIDHPGYATPKIDVRAAVINDGKILLVKEKADGRWAMPGGWCDVGDLPSEAVIRETQEESGYNVKPIKLIGVFDANRGGRPLEFFHAFKIIFLCQIIDGSPQTSDETTAVDFFNFEELPKLSVNRTNMKHIGEIRFHLVDSARPTAFD